MPPPTRRTYRLDLKKVRTFFRRVDQSKHCEFCGQFVGSLAPPAAGAEFIPPWRDSHFSVYFGTKSKERTKSKISFLSSRRRFVPIFSANDLISSKSLDEASFWGVVSGTGKPLCKATLQRMLTNKVYLGLIVHNGETYEGCFPAIVSRATFEKVQEVLKNRAKPRHSKKRHYFPFTGLLTCGECGAAITAQWAHGNGGTYRYYRCTKRLGSCSQRYLREDLLVEQLKDKISKVALCEDWKEKMLAKVEMWEKENKIGRAHV